MSDKQKENGVLRTLDLYTRLCEGKVINKQEEAQRYCVSDPVRSSGIWMRSIPSFRTEMPVQEAMRGKLNTAGRKMAMY